MPVPPRVVGELLDEWELETDGEPVRGRHALVVPARSAGVPVVLKVTDGQDDDGRPHDAGRHEILGLQTWQGHGAVRMLRADPSRRAMVLERLHRRDLTDVPVLQACEVVAGLYARLHVAPPNRLVPLTVHVETWVDALDRLPRHAPVPRRIVEQAVHLGRALLDDPGSTGRIVHGDLGFGHVLAGDREPWLAIAPRPVSGDPHLEVAPLLSGRWAEAVATGDVRTAVRRRFHTVVDVAGLDEDRARDWVVLREAWAALRAVEDGDHDRVTVAVAVVKAVQE